MSETTSNLDDQLFETTYQFCRKEFERQPIGVSSNPSGFYASQPKKPKLPDAQAIANTFDFDSGLIGKITPGILSSEELKIYTKDQSQKDAKLIAGKIRNKLKKDNSRKYGGLIRVGGALGKGHYVEISFYALEHLKEAIRKYTDENFVQGDEAHVTSVKY